VKIITYFLLIGFVLIGMGFLIKPQFINEIIWGILLPWVISSIEIFIFYHVYNKEVLKTTKVLIYGFITKMIVFGAFLLIIINFYSFNALAFVFSFLTSFLVFHTLETVFLKLLFDRKKI
tara:strand:- start:242 stop:601 length:360 start_codon:yes stop_codon:yes gene_type:complete